jgi:hypothetical protein
MLVIELHILNLIRCTVETLPLLFSYQSLVLMFSRDYYNIQMVCHLSFVRYNIW